MPDKPQYTWDKKTRRYRNERGQFSSSKKVRSAVDQLAATTQARMRELGQQVIEGKISVPQFQVLMAKELKNAHTTAFLLAKGGREQMTASDFGKLGAQLNRQYKYLQNFCKEIPRRISERSNRIISRAGMYGVAVIGTFENAVRDREKQAGEMIYERRVLGRTLKPCQTCIEEASKGWREIGILRAIGDSECRANCGCSFEFKLQS